MNKVLIAGLKKGYLETLEKWLQDEEIPFIWGESLEEITRVVERILEDPSEIRVVVTDLVLRDVGGMDFIDWLRRELPTAQVLVVGPKFSEVLQHILESEVENVQVLTGREIERNQILPVIRSGLKAVAGFEGRVTGMSLFDFLQLLSMGGYSATLRVENPRLGRRGSIFMREGQILHAETPEEKGKSALFEMMRWRSGTFVVEPEVPSDVPRSVRESTDFLLLEFARLMDESGQPVRARKVPQQEELDRIFARIEAEVPGFMGVALFNVEEGEPIYYRTPHPEFTFVTTARLYSELMNLVADTTEIATRGKETRDMVDMVLTRDVNDVIVMIPLAGLKYAVLLIYARGEGEGGETGIAIMDRHREELETIAQKLG